ncbi:uncharacterized protein LOC111400047 [Olea europaea var. sylvestris]|uniref:uncharacterized protein LOC111400047 n=1 Tax=Olea europaea var. sylvestris TaxID=158386 RepID=UPI000C1D2B38|nr:uncharacterized protein LOC111400047 [Olea europaea var. sylvestris]
MKRVSRPTRILCSPFVAGAGKLFRHDDNIIVFGSYKDNVEEGDKSTFLGWFQRGYKPKNRHEYFLPFLQSIAHMVTVNCSYISGFRKKFNEHDDVIKPAFVIGSYPVGNKTWFHQLVDPETSLNSGHMDACFYYIRQLAKFGKV